MFNLFKKPTQNSNSSNSNSIDFGYLDPSAYYFDSACTTLRPQSVIDAEVEYYQKFNSCGHRVKYKWGQQTDKLVEECRNSLLKLAGKSSRDYTVAFCLNTTHGINLVLQQIQARDFGLEKIITSDIDHNSCFLPSMKWAERSGAKRLVLERDELGNLLYAKDQLANAVVLTNTQSNIHGLELLNVKQLADDLHSQGGLLLLDACQTFGHRPEILQGVDFDAAFGSGHKMYGPSAGFIIIKKELIKKLDCYLIGGSTVQAVKLDSYELIENEDEIYARLESGLQDYGGIIGLGGAIKWQKEFLQKKVGAEIPSSPYLGSGGEAGGVITLQPIDGKYPPTNLKGGAWTPKTEVDAEKNKDTKNFDYEHKLAIYLNQKLKEIPEIKLLNPNPSPVVSLYSDKMDGHKMAMYLGEIGIMCRSGYHCCHYYLKEKMQYPPLFRISLGLHNTPEQIDYLIEKMKVILR